MLAKKRAQAAARKKAMMARRRKAAAEKELQYNGIQRDPLGHHRIVYSNNGGQLH